MNLVIDDRSGEWDAFVMEMLRHGQSAGSSLADLIYETLPSAESDEGYSLSAPDGASRVAS